MCCEDGLHCCPSGTTCDAASGMCRSTVNSLAISWHSLSRRSAIMSRLVAEAENDVQCPDKSSCADTSTCCQLRTGNYGCCPYQQVCRFCQFCSSLRYRGFCIVIHYYFFLTIIQKALACMLMWHVLFHNEVK